MGEKLHLQKYMFEGVEYTNAVFHCPGCNCSHVVKVDGLGSCWGWNCSITDPTLTPSIKVTMRQPEERICHSFVENGKIRYLSDCWHDLKGQVSEIPDWDTSPDVIYYKD